MKKKHLIITAAILCAAILLSVFLIYEDNTIEVSRYTMENGKITADFDGFRIVQISDLHNKRFGENQEKLLESIAGENPDIIVLTGDLIDKRRFNLEVAMEFVSGALLIAPVYFSSGNHEEESGHYDEIVARLSGAGVKLVEDTTDFIEKGGSRIAVSGLKNDETIHKNYESDNDPAEYDSKLTSFGNFDDFTILLAHRPELYGLYCGKSFDLVFSGHAHGGQIRLPYVGGLFAPSQGLFPKYDGGKFSDGITEMIVSRGLGNSVFPFRIFNRPEVVTVTLKSAA